VVAASELAVMLKDFIVMERAARGASSITSALHLFLVPERYLVA
jgi:hypothetical protein